MLKGHTKIELTDVNTGEVTIHEDDNMFTNAVYKTLNNTWTGLVGGVEKIKDWHLPLSQKMLGGIALFENSIEENETMNHFPKGNKVVGMSGTLASDGSKKWWGSRNLLESQAFDSETHSVKHVWDFSTSEANGTISAVGLMDGRQADFYGQSAWNKRCDRALNVTSYFSDYGRYIAEFKGDTFVAMTNGTGQVTIKKIRFNFDTVSLDNNLGTTNVISEKTVQLPNSGMNYTCTSWFDGDDGHWYGFINCTNSSCTTPTGTQDMAGVTTSSLYFQIIRINKETYGVEYHNISTPTGVYTCPRTGHPIITNKYIILPYSTHSSSSNWLSTQYVQYISVDKVCCVNKLDWTCVVKEFKDVEGNLYSMYRHETATTYCSGFLFGTWSNLKLKNGLYQMNDIIFDDDFVVQEQLKPYINSNTNVPVTKTDNISDGQLICNLIPCSKDVSSGKGSCLFMLPNEEKEIILIGGHFTISGFGSYSGSTGFVVYAVPYDSQKLMTINNLSEPVVKTASQTMKITYTITDVIEE